VSSSSSSSSGGTGSGSGAGGGPGAATSSSGTSSSSTSSTGFITLIDLSSLQVTADVAEADASSVAVGQPAVITFSATSQTVQGKVTQVAVSGTTSSNVVQYPVTVTLDSVPAGAKPGASVSVVITTGTKTNVIEVSSSAVTTVGNTHTVTVLDNGQTQIVPVQVGLVGNTTDEITSGLTAGQTVELAATTSTTTTTNGGFPGGFGGRGAGGGLGTRLGG
jgi:macrolide-specific efflux system membrane fusion protein